MSDEYTDGADRDFIEYVVKQIVDEPEKVEVERKVDELGVLIILKVGKFDMGKVIGKSGQTAKALRTLLRVIGSKINARVNLKIVEPDGSEVMMAGDMGAGSRDDSTGDDSTGDATATDDGPVVLEEDLADQHADMPDDLEQVTEEVPTEEAIPEEGAADESSDEGEGSSEESSDEEKGDSEENILDIEV